MFGFFSKKRIYLDYASATPVLKVALREMVRVSKFVGNPGSIHAEGVTAKKILAEARERIALQFGVKARELLFVSGGTEANNLAILGKARRIILQKGSLAHTHWITTTIEHPATLECFAEIERLGGEVSHLKPDKHGIIRAEELERTLRKETVFFSIAWANHEIGIIQPLSALSGVIREHEKKDDTTVLLHVDAGQLPLYKPAQPHSIGADIVSIDSGKLYGPRGVGVVYISNHVDLAPIILGGKQERGLRAGTENVALAAGFAAALEFIVNERASEAKRISVLRDFLADELLKVAQSALINGEISRSLPHMLNISLPEVNSEYLTLALDNAGIAVATKSACREGEESISHVVEELGGDEWRSKSTIRISLGRETNSKDIAKFIAELSRLLRNRAVL